MVDVASIRRRLRGERVPATLKVGYLVFLLGFVPLWAVLHGWEVFLWFSDVALLLTFVAASLESRRLASMIAVGVLLPEALWNAEFLLGLATGWTPIGVAAYMFDAHRDLAVRGVSMVFHIGLFVVLLWLVWRLGYDRRAWWRQVLLGWALLVATWFLVSPERNINWVYGPGEDPQTWMPAAAWLGVMLAAYPLLVVLPTHRLLCLVFPESGHGGGSVAASDNEHRPAKGDQADRAPLRQHQVSTGRLAKQALLFALLVVLLLSWPIGCTATLTPPARPADPATVYLLDHGHTPSLILPTPEGELARYAFGDLRYYGRGEQSLWTGAAALFVPTAGGLGRSEFTAPPRPEQVVARVPVYVEHAYVFEVEREAAYRLEAKLDARFHEQLHTFEENPAAGLDFVDAGRSYTWFYNSNHALADWLRDLGVEVCGPTFVSSWRLDRPEGKGSATLR